MVGHISNHFLTASLVKEAQVNYLVPGSQRAHCSLSERAADGLRCGVACEAGAGLAPGRQRLLTPESIVYRARDQGGAHAASGRRSAAGAEALSPSPLSAELAEKANPRLTALAMARHFCFIAFSSLGNPRSKRGAQIWHAPRGVGEHTRGERGRRQRGRSNTSLC